MGTPIKIERNAYGQLIVNGQRCLVSYIRGGYINLPPEKRIPVEGGYYLQIRKWYNGPVGICVALPGEDDILYGYSKIDINCEDRKLLNNKSWRDSSTRLAVLQALEDPAVPPFAGIRLEIASVLTDLSRKAVRYFLFHKFDMERL